MAPEVCVVGEINPDLILYGLPQGLEPEKETLASGFRMTLGSSSAIFAHNLAALGTAVGMVSKIGTDPLGEVSLSYLHAAGVDVSRVKTDAATPTGVTVILAQRGSRYILTYPGTISELSYEDLDFDYMFSARHLHVSSFFLQRGLRPRLAEIFHAAKAEGLTTSMDTNDDPENKWDRVELERGFRELDLLFVNEREAKKITGDESVDDAIATLAKMTGTVVVKLGADGALVRRKKDEWRGGAVPVNVIDTVGAGDSFDAGYIRNFLRGATPATCLRFANVAGAFSTTGQGGIEAFRSSEGLKKFLADHDA